MVIGSAVTAITYRVKSDRWGGSMRRFSSGNYAGSAKISFKKSGCTSRSASSWLNRPGQTSGHFSFTVQITNYKSTPGSTIDFQLIDAAGHESNILRFTIDVWSCELRTPEAERRSAGI